MPLAAPFLKQLTSFHSPDESVERNGRTAEAKPAVQAARAAVCAAARPRWTRRLTQGVIRDGILDPDVLVLAALSGKVLVSRDVNTPATSVARYHITQPQ